MTAETMRYEDKCVFCRMFDGKPDVFMDIEPLNPVVKGHRIVIPREHCIDFTDMPYTTARTVEYAAIRAKEIGGAFNLITSKGKAATQSVFHLHVHLVPRKEGDDLLLPWSNQIKH